MTCLLFIGSMLTSCDSDNLNTDQYGNEIALNSFGPCPVLRGGTLRFLGTNLDQITSITIPGCDPITNITVVSTGQHSEITVQVPKENCTEGYVTLTTPKGGTLTTGTKITYEEDITIDKFYVGQEGTLTGNVGDSLTIIGDYLNKMHAVIFTDGIKVPEKQIGTHTRYMIKVAIPKYAKTGKITLSDEAEDANYLTSESELAINLPTCTAMSPTKAKAGGTITFTGTSLTLIKSVTFTGAEVDSAALSISADGKSLSCELPATATDGEVNLVTYSGVNVPAGTLETIVPTNLALSSNPIKNDETITITGKDLDLVTGIAYTNASGAIATQSATTITSVVPTAAKDGNITLSLANGKTVTIAYTLIKPEITSFTPSTITAGNTTTVVGTNLDLVSKVTFQGENTPTATISSQSATSLTMKVPSSAAAGTVTFILKNGTTVTSTGLTINATVDPVISSAPDAVPGKEVTLTGSNLSKVQSFYFGTTLITTYKARDDNSITITVPASMAIGTFEIKMIDYSGNTFSGGNINIVPSEYIITENAGGMGGYTFPGQLAWADGGRFRIYYNEPTDLTKLTLTTSSHMYIYKTSESSGQIQINDANWGTIVTLDLSAGTEKVDIPLTAAYLTAINSTRDGWSNTCFVVQGSGATIVKITIAP
jgi:hypothetical protein